MCLKWKSSKQPFCVGPFKIFFLTFFKWRESRSDARRPSPRLSLNLSLNLKKRRPRNIRRKRPLPILNLNHSPTSRIGTSKHVNNPKRGRQLGLKPQLKNRGVQELHRHSIFLKNHAVSRRINNANHPHILTSPGQSITRDPRIGHKADKTCVTRASMDRTREVWVLKTKLENCISAVLGEANSYGVSPINSSPVLLAL